MRVVTTPNFCKACLEGLWLQLLRNVSLIDGIDEFCIAHAEARMSTALSLRLVPLAQLRTAAVDKLHESYTVTWSKDGAVQDDLTNKTHVVVEPGTYSVSVKYTTSEVRVDQDNRLSAHMDYTVTDNCAGAID